MIFKHQILLKNNFCSTFSTFLTLKHWNLLDRKKMKQKIIYVLYFNVSLTTTIESNSFKLKNCYFD